MLIIVINIIKITKTVTNPTSYKKILEISIAKSATHLFIILKIADINMLNSTELIMSKNIIY